MKKNIDLYSSFIDDMQLDRYLENKLWVILGCLGIKIVDADSKAKIKAILHEIHSCG